MFKYFLSAVMLFAVFSIQPANAAKIHHIHHHKHHHRKAKASSHKLKASAPVTAESIIPHSVFWTWRQAHPVHLPPTLPPGVKVSLPKMKAAMTQTATTINPNIPAFNAPLSSGVLRQNFQAAANDINVLFATLANNPLPTAGAGININAGVISLAAPTSSALGGVRSFASVPHQFITSLSTSGGFTTAQPQFSDIAGQLSAAQLPPGTTTGPASTTVGHLALWNNATGSSLSDNGVITAEVTIGAADSNDPFQENSQLFASGGPVSISAAAASAGADYVVLRPTDANNTANYSLFISQDGPTQWGIGVFNGVDENATIAIESGLLETGPIGVSFTPSTQALQLVPSNMGVGIPEFIVTQDAVPSQYDVELFDGVSVTGTVQFLASGLLFNGSPVLTASTGASALFTQTGTGAQPRSVASKFTDTIDINDFGAVCDGTSHPLSSEFATLAAAQGPYPFVTALTQETDYAAIQAAINSRGVNGGRVHATGKCQLGTSAITIGNGTAAAGNAGWSTLGAVELEGSVAASIGVNNPLGGFSLNYSGPGSAITVNGPLAGWSVENVFISCTGTATTETGLTLIEAQYGDAKNVTFENCPGFGLLTTTRGNNNTFGNVFSGLRFFLPASVPTAAGILLSSTTANVDTAHNTFIGTFIQPSASGQNLIWFQGSDTNTFVQTVENPCPSCTANGVVFDFSGPSAAFPQANKFDELDPANNIVTVIGTPSSAAGGNAFTAPNKMNGFSRANGAILPHLPILVVQDFYGTVGGTPTLGSNCGGTGSSVVAGSTNESGEAVTQSTAVGTCTLNFATPGYPNEGPFCSVTGFQSQPINFQAASATGITFTYTSIANYRFTWQCKGN